MYRFPSISVRIGMRKDYILTPEQKMFKQKHLEDNRRLRNDSPSVTTDSFKPLTPIVSPTSDKVHNHFLRKTSSSISFFNSNLVYKYPNLSFTTINTNIKRIRLVMFITNSKCLLFCISISSISIVGHIVRISA